MNRISLAVATALIGLSTVAEAAVELKPVGRYQSPTAGFDKGAAEIVAYDASTQRIFVVNAQDGTVDVLDGSNPASPLKIGQIDAKAIPGYPAAGLGAANSVAARDGLVAVAVEANPLTSPGVLAFYDAASLAFIRSVPAGALPDAVAFSNTGHFVIVANEGEPRTPVDPEGSVTIVDVRRKGKERRFDACTADFRAFNSRRAELVAAGVYIDPGAASVAQDLEPEYASAQGNNAYVTLQENNAIAVVQLNQCRVARIMPIGAKNHGLPENSLDTSDREIDNGKGRIAIRSWQNLHALYQPDSIASYEADDGQTYLVIANEGDVRDTAISGRASTDAVRVGSLSLDSTAFPPVPASVSPDPDPKSSKNLGRLNVIRSLRTAGARSRSSPTTARSSTTAPTTSSRSSRARSAPANSRSRRSTPPAATTRLAQCRANRTTPSTRAATTRARSPKAWSSVGSAIALTRSSASSESAGSWSTT